MSRYTDADVKAATHAVMDWNVHLASREPSELAWRGAEVDVRLALESAAPAIAARAKAEALREVADRLSGEAHREPILQRFADKFTARADDIEDGL